MPNEIDPKVQAELGNDLSSLAVPEHESTNSIQQPTETQRTTEGEQRNADQRDAPTHSNHQESLSEQLSERHEELRDRNLEGAPLPNLLVTRTSSPGTSTRQNHELDEMARQNQVQMTKNDRRKKRRSEIPESIRGIVDILETALPNTQLQELLETAVEGASSGSSLQLSTNELRNLSQDIFEKIKHCLANGDLAANDDLENALEVFLDESQDSLDENARKTIAKRIVELHEERRADRVIAAEKREELGELLQPLLRRLRAFPLAGQPGSRYDSLEELAAELAELPIEFDFLKHENFESLDELVDALAVLVQEHSGSELSHREAYYISDLLVLHRSTYAIFQAIEDSATAQIMRAATGEATPNNSSPIFDNREFFSRYPSLREECESRFESRKQALTRELDTELADFAELTLSLQEALARDVLDAGELSELLLRVSGLEHGDLFLQYFEAASSESLESALADFLKSEDVEIVSDLLGHDPTTLAALQLATDFSLLERSHAEEPARRAEIEDSLVHSIIGGPEELLKRYDSLFGTLANDRALFSPRALIAIEAREENNTALLAAVELKRQIEDQGEGFSLDKLLQFLNQHSPEDRGEILKQFQERFSIDLIEVFSTGELPGALYSNGTSQRNGVTLYVSDEDRQVRAALLEATVSGDEQLFRAAKLREIVLRGQQESMFHGEGSHQTLSEILAYYSTQEDFRLVELRSAYESRFSSNLTQDIEHSFDSADYVDQYQQRHQGTGASDAHLRAAERKLLENMLSGVSLDAESVLIVLEHDASRLGKQLALQQAHYRSQGNVSEAEATQAQIDRLKELAGQLSSTTTVGTEVVRLSVNEAHRTTFIPEVSRQVWAMGRDHRRALGLDNDKQLPNQEALLQQYLDGLNVTGELRTELEQFYKQSFDHVTERMRQARVLAHQLYDSIDGYNFSHEEAFKLLTNGRFDEASEIRGKVDRAYLDKDILEYLPDAFQHLTGGRSLYLRIDDEAWGSEAVEDKIQDRLLNTFYASYSSRSRFEATLDDIERFAPKGLSGQEVIARLQEKRSETVSAVALREALSSDAPVFSALKVLNGFNREAVLAEYERLFGVSFVADAEQLNVQRMTVDDPELSAQDGVYRQRELSNAYDILVLAAQGTDPGSDLFQQALEEYAFVRLELLSRREGELSVGAVDRLDISRGSSFVVDTNLVERARAERQAFEATLDEYFGNNSEVRAFQRQYVRQATSEAAAAQFTQNVQILRYQETLAQGLARDSEHRDRTRGALREREILTRYLEQVDPNGVLQNSSSFQSLIQGGPQGGKSYLQQLDDQASADLKAALKTAQELNDAMSGWGTYDKRLQKALRDIDPRIRHLTIQVYEIRFGVNLMDRLHDDLSGNNAQEAFARYAGDNLFADQVVLFAASEGWGSSESRIREALEHSVSLIDTQVRQELTNEGLELQERASRLRSLGGNDQEASTLLLEAQSLLRAAKLTDPDNERYERKFREKQIAYSHSFDVAYRDRGMTFDSELMTEDELDNPELARAIWNQPLDPDARLMLEFRSTLDGDVNGAGRALEGEVDKVLEKFLVLSIQRESDGKIIYTELDQNGREVLLPEFRPENLQMFARWAAVEAASGRLDPSFARFIAQAQSVEEIFEDEFGVPREAVLSTYEQFYASQVLQPRYLPLIADGSILSPEKEFHFTENSEGKLLLAGEAFSAANQLLFRRWAHDTLSPELRAQVESHNGPLQELLVQGNTRNEALIQAYEQFYHNEILDLDDIRAAFEERIDELDEAFRTSKGKDESLRDYVYRESVNAGPQSIGWLTALLDGDLVEAQAHAIKRSIAGAGTYDKLLNHSIQPHEHVLTRMRALEQQMWEMQTEYGEAVQGNAGYLALQQELELYASRVRTRFDGVEAVYSANYGDIWDQVRGDIGRERYVILRSVAEEGTLSRAAQVRLALKGSWDGTELEDLKSTLSGLTKEELDQLAIDLYVLDHEIGRSRRDTVDKDEAIEYLRDQLNSETSGDDWYEVRILLVGEPRTVEQMWELMELHQKHVRGALGSGLTDIFGDADDRFDDVYGEFRALYFSEYLSDNSEQKARAERRLRALFANATVSAQAALEQRNSVADTIIDTGTTVIVVGGAVAAGFFSFGAGTVAILTAAAAVGRIAGGATLKGGSYGSGQFATDLGMTAVDFATMGAGKYISMGARRVGGSIAARLAARGIQNPAALRAAARIAAEASEEVTERAGVAVATAIEEGAEQAAKKVAVETVKQVGEQTVVKQLSKQAVREFLMKGPIGGEAAWQWGAKIIDSRFITRVAMNATEGALDGAVTGFALGAGQVGIREETWEHGFGNGLHMMLSAGGQNALIGGAFGAKFGAAMGAISSPKYLYSRNDPNSLISQLESGHAPKQRTLTVERRVGEVTDRVASARDRAQVAKEALEEIRLGNRDATRAEIRDLKVKAKESHFVSSGETSANIEADMRFRGYDDAQAIVARDALTTFDAEVRISKLERGHRLKLAFGELAQPNTSVGKRFSDFREALGEWWGARGQIRANRAQRYVKYQEAIVTQGTSKRLSGLETVTPSLRAEARSAELAKFKSRESLIPLRGGKSLPNFKEAVLQFREFQKAADTFFHSYGKKRIQENSNALRKIALEQEATALKNNKHEQVSETVVSLREGSLNAQVKYENLALQRAEAWAKLKRGQLPGWDLVSLDLGSQVRQARRAAVRRHHAFQVGLDLPRRVEARLSIVDNSPAVIERAIDVETLSLQRDLNKVQRRQNRLRIVTDFAQGRFKSSADNFRSARSLSESLQASGERVRGLRRQTDLDILEHYAHGILPDNPDLAAKWALETAKMNSHLAAYHHAADHHPLARLNLKEAAKAIPAYFERRPTDRLFRAAEFEVNIGKMRTAEYKSRFDAYMSKIPAEQSAVASRLANADIDVKSSFQRMKNAYVEQMDALASGDGKRVRELSETIRKQRREYFAARKRRSDARASFQIEVQTIEIQAKRPDISIAAARREAEAVVLFKRSLNPLSDENPLETLERKLARQRRNRGLQLEQERLVSYAERIDPNNQADVKLANQRAAAERTFQQRKREFHAIRDRYESALHMGGNGDDFRVIEARYERKLREFQRASSERKAVRERFRIRQREFSIAQETDRMVQEGIARNRASRIAAANYDSRVALRQGKLLTAYREHNMAVYLEKPEVRFAKFERKFQAGVTALGEGESALTLAHTRADAWRKLNQARYELRVRERHVFDQLATGNGGDLDFAALEARQAQLREELDVAKKTYKTVNAEYKKQVRERKAAERAIRDAEAHFGIDGDIAQARTIKQERFDALTQAEGEYNFLKTEKRRNRIGEVIDFVTRDGEGLKQRRLRQQQLEQELATATTDLRRARERAHLDHEKSLIDKSSYSNRETQKDVREALLQNSRAKASLDEASKRPVTGIFERRAARKEIRKANMVLASLQEEASFATRRDQHLRELLTSPDRGARSYRRPAEVRAAAEGFAGALTRSEDLGNRLKRELGAIRRGQIDSLSDLASTSVELAKAKVAERRASRKFRQEVQIEHFAESAHQQLGGSTETLEVAREYAAARAKRNRLSSRADRLLENATGLVQGRRRVTSPSEAMEIELQFREARARFREAQRIEQFGSTTGVSEAAGKVRAAELEQLAAKREGRVIDTSSVKKARREMRSRERVARHDIKMVANAEDHGFAIQDYTIVDSGRAQRVTAHVDQSRPRAKISSAGPRPERNLIDEVVTLREQLDSLHSRLQQAKSLPEKRALEIDIRNTREQIAHLSGDGGMIPDEFGFTSRDYETLLGDMRVQVEQQHNSFAASEDGLTGARESEILENLGGEGAVTEDRAVQDLYRRQSELIQEQRVATKTRQDAIDIELERIADQIALKESGANVIHETSSGVHRSSGNSGGESGDSFGGSDSDWGTPKGGDGNTGGGTGGKGAVAEDGASSQNRQGDDSPEWMGEGYEEVLADIRNQDRQFEQGDYDFLRDTDGGEDFGGSGGGSRGSDRGPHGPSRQSGGGLSTQEREARTVLKMTPDGETAGPGFGPRNKGPAGAVDAIDEVSTFEPQLQLEPEKVDVAVAVLEKPITATETPTSRLEVDLQPGRHVGPGAPVELDFTLHKTPEIGVHISPDRQLERAVEVDPRTTTRSSTRGENQFRLHATPVLAEQQMALLADIQWKVHAQPESTIQPKVQDEPNRKGRKLRLGGDDDYGRGRIGEYPMWDVTLSVFKKSDTWDPRHLPSFQSIDPKDRRRIFEMLKDFWGEREIIRYTEWV